MVSQVIDHTPDLIPLPPDWMRRQQEQSAPSENRNINDIYWRKPDGWIIVGPSAVRGANGRPLTAQAEGWIRRGYEPLIEYSYTDRVSDKTGHRDTIETNADKLNTPDRYWWLFKNGGAHLFSIKQIVEHHWHIKPPYGLPTSVFPQLLEWEVPDPYWCPVCPGTRPPKNSEEQVVTHLQIEHRMNLMQTRDLQQTSNGFRDAPATGDLGLGIRRRAQAIEQQAEATQAQAPVLTPRLIICNDCGESFPDGLAKGRHVKAMHPKVAPV